MKIITLTLNPAFDVHCRADGFAPYRESIVEITSRDAGGKGVNISRALTANAIESTAVVLVGDENGDELCRLLADESIRTIPVRTHGRIRENITLHESDKPETRISFGGFTATADTLSEIVRAVGEIDENTVLTLTGSIPRGIDPDAVIDMLRGFKSRGARLVIDSRSLTLDRIVGLSPWLIKPNKDEAEVYTGKAIDSAADAAKIAARLCDRGIENVMISLGGDGAVLATGGECLYAIAPQIRSASTVGAGDSAIAGFIAAGITADTATPTARLTLAVAYGTAACLRPGTLPPLPSDVAEIAASVKIHTL